MRLFHQKITGEFDGLSIMRKLTILAVLILLSSSPECIAQDKKFIAGFELGPSLSLSGPNSLSILQKETRSINLDLLSIWLKFGCRFKKYAVITEFGTTGANSIDTTNDESFNALDCYLLSMEQKLESFSLRRFAFNVMGGAGYSYYKVTTASNGRPSYRHSDKGFLLGLETETELRKGPTWHHYVRLTYKYYFYEYDSRMLSISYRFGGYEEAFLFFRFFYFGQRDIFDLYVLSVGADLYFNKLNLF